jgi:hypothetical protein
MKVQELVAILESGKKPLVKLTGDLWSESFGRKEMIARVIRVKPPNESNCIEFTFDYNEHRAHNLALDRPNRWVGTQGRTGSAIEARIFDDPNNLFETVFFDYDANINAEFTGKLMNEFIQEHGPSDKLTYVEWLEKELINCRMVLE